jgi:hypothetical protein
MSLTGNSRPNRSPVGAGLQPAQCGPLRDGARRAVEAGFRRLQACGHGVSGISSGSFTRRLLPALIAVAATALAAGMVLSYVLAFGVDVPINDDWDLLETSLAWHEQGIDVKRLVKPHNEHCLAISRLSTHTILAATGGSFRTVLAFNALLAVAAVGTLAWFVRRWPLATGPRAALLAAIALLVTSWCQWQNWLWSFQTPWFLLPLLVTLGSVAAVRLASPVTAAAVAGGTAILAIFCQANGLLVGLALVPTVVLRLRTEPRRVALVAGGVYAVLAVVALGLGLSLLGKGPGEAGGVARLAAAPLEAFRCLLAVLGSPLDPQGTFAGRQAVAGVCGGISLAVGSTAVIVGLLQAPARARELGPAIALMAYGLGSVAAVVVGRMAMIAASGIESRYQTLAISWHVGTLLACGWLATNHAAAEHGDAELPAARSWSHWQFATIAAATACLVVTLTATPVFLAHGRNMRAALEGQREIYARANLPGGREALASIAAHYGADRLARNLDRMERAGLLPRRPTSLAAAPEPQRPETSTTSKVE